MKIYSNDEVYQLIKEKFPQYNDDTIMIRKYSSKPAVTFKNLIMLILIYRTAPEIGKQIDRIAINIRKNLWKIFPKLTETQQYWDTKLLNLVNLKRCSKCGNILEIFNFSKANFWCKSCMSVNSKIYYQNNKEQKALYNKEYYKKTREKHNKICQEYYREHKEQFNSYKAKRKAAKLQRIPIWVSQKELNQIKNFYKNCPKNYHVDHIIPLQGTNVSGFHCLSNLQYLPASENLSKGNKYTPKIEIY